MKQYKFTGDMGDFEMESPEKYSYLYFPIANEAGVMSSVTPGLAGDIKQNQNAFLMEPVSAENLHESRVSRNFWVYDGAPWSATGNSAPQIAEHFFSTGVKTFLKAGMLYHTITREDEKRGLASEITSFAPCADSLELMKVTVKNIGSEDKEITCTAAIPMYGRSADNIRDHRHVTSLLHRTEVRPFGICINPTLTFDERGHKLGEMTYGVFASEADGAAPAEFFPVTEEYIGEGGVFTWPEAVVKNLAGTYKPGDKIDGYETVGAMRFKKRILKAGESVTYIVGMGFGKSFSEMEDAFAKYNNASSFDKALSESKAFWQSQVNVKYHTGNPDLDNWMYWVNLQPSLRRIYGCSFLPHHDYGKGGRGWRDLWQDCLALLMMNPDGVRSMLLSNFGGVRMDGSNATIIGTKQGEFVADRNNITRVWMDHGMWPYLTTKLYIDQSGDLKFLLEDNVYFKDPQVLRGEAKDTLWEDTQGNNQKDEEGNTYRGSVLEHMLIQHLTAFFDVGEHGNIRLRGADWNDALDMAKERGESVAFTTIYGDNLRSMAGLIRALAKKEGVSEIKLPSELLKLIDFPERDLGDVAAMQKALTEYCESVRHTVSGKRTSVPSEKLAENLEAKAAFVKKHILENEVVTDGKGNEWINGYYDNSGRRVEGGDRMMLTGQVFAVMSGTAPDELVGKIAKAADTYLYDEAAGGYRLNTDFKELKTDMGRMFGFAYGTKENGAVFSHMTTMYANALYQRGFAKEGYKAFNTLASHCLDTEKSKIYPGVPEYIDPKGRGLYHYLTGAASWLLMTVVTEMFGVKGILGDLTFTPKLLACQFDEEGKASLNLDFAGRHLRVIYENAAKAEYGTYSVRSIKLSGKEYKETIPRADIVALSPDTVHDIVVSL